MAKKTTGFSLVRGSREIDTPGTFNLKDTTKILEKSIFGNSTPYGKTEQKQVMSGPKQQIGEDAFKRTYREASEATVGKSLGSTSETSNVQEGIKIAYGEGGLSGRLNILEQRQKFEKQFGKGAIPSKPFIDPKAVGNLPTANEYPKALAKQQKRSEQRMQSNILAEQTRRSLQNKPISITVTGIVDPSSGISQPTSAKKILAPTAKSKKKSKRGMYSKAGVAIRTIGTYLPNGSGAYGRRKLEKTARKGLF